MRIHQQLRRTWPALAVALLVASLPVGAQSSNSASISGTVTDPSGAALSGVVVKVAGPNLIGGQASLTNDQGLFRFPQLPVGGYAVRFEHAGFSTLVREGITLNAGFSAELNVSLSLASVQGAVTVSAETPLVDAQNSNIQQSFEKDHLQNLPTARDIWAMTGVSSGIRISNPDVGGSQTGSQGSMTSYGYSGQARTQLDGINTTEGRSAAGFYFDFGSFQEVSVSNAANDASVPVPGQFINAVLKSGGNRFHGSFYQDYESGALQSSNVSAKQLSQGAGMGNRLTEYHDTNGDLGGPLRKDRLWFYTSLRNQLAGRTVTGFPAEAPSSNTDVTSLLQNITYKLSGNISPRHRLAHFVQWERKLTPLTNAASNYYLDAAYIRNLPGWTGGLQYDGVLTSRLFATVRTGVWGYNVLNAQDASLPRTPRRTEQQTGNQSGTYPAFRYNRRRVQIEPSGSYFLDRFLGANHQLKFGWLSERELYNNQQYGPYGEVALTYNSAAGLPDFTTPYRVTLYNGPTTADDYQRHHGAYLQDQIRLSRRLTLNAGLRWDYYRVFENDQKVRPDSPFRDFFYAGGALPNGYSIPATFSNFTIPGREVVRYPALVLPRLGLAWDLSGSGKAVLKLAWGRFSSNPNTDFGSSTNPLASTTYTFNWKDLNGDRLFQPAELGSFVSNAGGAGAGVAAGIRNPTVDDASVFVERQFGADLSVRAGFVYRALRHDWQRVDIARPWSLFTATVNAYDPGPDGVKGTADDRGSFAVADVPASTKLPASVVQYQTPDGNSASWRNFEVTVNKRLSRRWTAVGTWFYTLNQTRLNGEATTPNAALNNDVHTTDWTAHVAGTYQAPWGIQLSSIARGQSGTPLGRYLQVSLASGTFNAPVEPVGTYRSDNIWLFDARAQKSFHLGEWARIEGFFDAFNLLNSNANLTQDNVTGVRTVNLSGVTSSYQRFLSPTNVISPRVFRLGLRFAF